MAFYLKRSVARDAPSDIAYRVAYRQATERANADTFTKFPKITADNFAEAVRFKDKRIAELIALIEGAQ